MVRQIGLVSTAIALCWAQAGLAQQSDGYGAKIGKTIPESVPGKPVEIVAPAGAPNVIFWMIDDLGFGQLGSYGGLIETPNLDRLAQQGLRYNNYHTQPICSASRAAMLTGRNSHTVHMGGHATFSVGFPGYDGRVPRSAGTVAENLRQAGYVTYALGKWDHLPSKDVSAAGPFTYWPSGQGFDRYYGFLSADTDNFSPVLWADHQPASQPKGADYHLTADLADRAIEWIGDRGADSAKRPFFMYWATGAVHAPHHAPKAYLDRYRGRFDIGWDKLREQVFARQKKMGLVPKDAVLSPRPQGMQPWNSLSGDQKRSYARAMEAFAAQLTHADAEFGRILDALEKRGELSNTLVMVTADNGASAEGGPNGTFSENYFNAGFNPTVEQNLKHYDEWGRPGTFVHYPFGWAVAGNTPFRYYKQLAYEGGIRVPLIVSWPKGIQARGEIREQFQVVTDITPTILDAAGVRPAAMVNNEKQMPFDGISMTATFSNRASPTTRSSQYFEMFGNRAIWADGWKAVVPYRTVVWDALSDPPFNDDGWELYNLNKDFNELNNLAAKEPARLRAMINEFDSQARKFNIYPLQSMGGANQLTQKVVEEERAARNWTWAYTDPVMQVNEALAPPLATRSYTVDAKLDLPDRANGVVMAMGGNTTGVSLYFNQGVPTFAFRSVDMQMTRLSTSEPLPKGPANITVNFDRKGGRADAALFVNGKQIATKPIAGDLPKRTFSLNETFDVGSDVGTQVSPDYGADNTFDGRIERLEFKAKAREGE